MAQTMSVTEARAALPELLKRVGDGEEVTLTRHGKPVAVIVRPEALRARRADHALAAAERLDELVDRARRRPLPDHPALTSEAAEALVAGVRASRRRR